MSNQKRPVRGKKDARKAEKQEDPEEPALLAQMRRNPKGDWNSRDLEAVSKALGLRYTPPRGGGSHYKVSSPRLKGILTVPYKRPIKPWYIKRFVALAEAHVKAAVQLKPEARKSAEERRAQR